MIYFPSRILKEMNKPTGSRNPFAWIVEASQATEDEIISMAGLDAAVYLTFITTALMIMVLSAGLCLPVLLPLSVTDNNYKRTLEHAKNKTAASYDDFSKLSMGNIQEKSNRLWGFVIAAYWVSFVTYYVLWKTYKYVRELRSRTQGSSMSKPEQFAVLVRDIPPVPVGITRQEQVDSFFRRMYPETYERSLIVTDIAEADKVWTELKSYRKKLARAEVIFEKSKTVQKPEGTRPLHKTGTLGLVGEKVDSIDFYNEKIKDLSIKLETKQKITLREKQLAAAFIIFNSRPAAAAAAQVLNSENADTWTATLAPEPCQVLWKNLAMPFYQRMFRQKVVYIIVFLTVVFYMVPITLISALTTLDNLRKLLPFLKSIVDIKALKSVLEAYLPQLALILFLCFLPTILMILSKAEGIPSESHAVRASSGKYFYFIVFNVFLGVTIGGTLFQSLKQIEKDPNSIVNLLGNSLPPNASFFISFVALKFFVGYGLELSRLVPLVIYHVKRKYLCKTETELKQAWAPPSFGYATKVPNDMLIVTIALCYSVIAPMILPFAILYFSVGWFVLRNQALNVYVPSYESNGRMWPHMHTRILAALILSQITMFAYFSIKKFVYSPLLIPLPIISLGFGGFCRKRFYPSFRVTSMEVACNDVKEVPSSSSVVKAFTPSCLLVEDDIDDIEQNEDARPTTSSKASSVATANLLTNQA